MRQIALRGLLARKLRLALTAFAVALGVTLIAGTYVFTDTINSSFDRIFAVSYKSVDIVLTPNNDLAGDDGNVKPLDESLITQVVQLPGIKDIEGSLFDQNGAVLGKNGKPVSNGGAPMFIASLHDHRVFESLQLSAGHFPTTADELAIDKATADRKGFKIGDQVAVQGVAPKKFYTLVGITTIAGVDSLGGATVALLTLPEAQRMTGKIGKVDEIDVAVRSGVDTTPLIAQIKKLAGPGVTVRTGKAQAADQSDQIRSNLSFLSTFLLVFAGISVFVGAFIIFNTFSITVAQRAREFALLRTLGASRRQVLRSVLTEGLVIGVVGSAIGLGLGIVVAGGLRALFKSFGVDLPSSGSVILTRTVIVALVVGVLVTLVACLAPAIRATRVPPVAALREGVALPETRSSRFLLPVSIFLTVVGVALLAVGLFAVSDSSTALSLVGGGAAVTFFGVALLSPRLVGPLAAVVGLPLQRLFGLTGRLARQNSVRHPGRTATTAAALMIGVALVCFASIFAAGAKKTIADAVDNGLRGQVILQNQAGFGAFSPGAGRAVAQLPGVADVSHIKGAQTRVTGVKGKQGITGIDPASFETVYHVTVKKGPENAIRQLAPGQVIVTDEYAKKHHSDPGSVLVVKTPDGATLRWTVTGVVKDKGKLIGPLVASNAVLRRTFGVTADQLALVRFTSGKPEPALKRAIDGELKDAYPQVEARTAEQFKSDQRDQINQLLNLVYALLALSVIVALFGIVNTLILSITERTRELGMLRAIGTSRRQVKRMIRLEAVITAMIGGMLGVILGVGLAVLVTRAIDGFSLAIPVATLVVVLLASGIAGVLAAMPPARRAARLDVLEALAYE